MAYVVPVMRPTDSEHVAVQSIDAHREDRPTSPQSGAPARGRSPGRCQRGGGLTSDRIAASPGAARPLTF